MFFKVVKSLLSFDGALKRITSNPGGQNLNIVFAYVTSLAFEKMMNAESPNNKKAIDILKEKNSNWITPKSFLELMKWGGETPSEYSIFMVRNLFDSFVQDDVMLVQGDYPNQKYQLTDLLDFPSNEQIRSARKSNKFFMMAMDDLIGLLPEALKQGKQISSRSKSSLLPLWEALLSDPLSDIFRSEMLFQAQQNFPKLKDQGEIHIMELGCGTGTGTVRLISDLIENYKNVKIVIHCYEEIGNLLRRARERVQNFDRKVRSKYSAKGLQFKYHFSIKAFRNPITLADDSIDLIISYQHLHYLSRGERYDYFENLARMVTQGGSIVVAQTTSHSDVFPHPLTLAFLGVEGFKGYPTVESMKEVISLLFNSSKSSGIDSIWVVKNPKYYN